MTAFVLSKAAVPHLLASGGGSIVNISSAIGRLRDRGFVAYGTAKAALSHMTKLMAADLAPSIRVNGIAVGSVATSALETVLTDDAIREGQRRLWGDAHVVAEPGGAASLAALLTAAPTAAAGTRKGSVSSNQVRWPTCKPKASRNGMAVTQTNANVAGTANSK